jgi:MFS family permease
MTAAPNVKPAIPVSVNRRQRRLVFYVIIFAQFCGTSLWFAGNAVLPQLQSAYGWPASAPGYLTSATQLGFISGTLLFAVLGVADRFSPSRLFFASSLAASAFNLLALADVSSYPLVLISRCLVGIFLAGIYPVGMKIAADWQAEGLGHWLGALVGALVLGTAFPHSLKLAPQFMQPTVLLVTISALSLAGAVLLLVFVPDGPYRKKASAFSLAAIGKIFRNDALRSSAFGYFGHMWEVYAYWAFVPFIVMQYQQTTQQYLQPSLLSFLIIASGAVGCVAGGIWSFRIGSFRVAAYALLSSGLCCLISPLIWIMPLWLFVAFTVFWGITVAADSPQFSALVARNAPEQLRGSAITLVTCIGFCITIVSIQLLVYTQHIIPREYLFLLLLPGPVAGVFSLIRFIRPVAGRSQ